MAFKLRDYQTRSIQKTLEYMDRSNNPGVVVAPTAAGKSLLISQVVKEWGQPALVLQPNVELLRQNLSKLQAFGGHGTVCSASDGRRDISELTYATIGSVKNNVQNFRDFGVKTLIIDECDMNLPPDKGSIFRDFIDSVGFDKIIGYTATPFRLKRYSSFTGNYAQLNMINRIEPKVYTDIIDVIQVQEMVDNKFWAKINYELWDFDTSKLQTNTSGTEFSETSIHRAILDNHVNTNITGRIATLIAEGKSVLAFLDSVDNAEIMALKLPKTAVISSRTKPKERTRIINDFKSGELKAVLNFDVLTAGFDYPELDAVILGRPTMSFRLIYQMLGRLVRNPLHPLQKEGLLIDFCNNIKRFGQIEHLVIDEVESTGGWAATNKDVILTGFPMDNTVTLSDLSKGFKDDVPIKITFGKYSGRDISELPKDYASWLYNSIDSMNIKGYSMQDKRVMKSQLLKTLSSNAKFVEDNTKKIMVDFNNVIFSLHKNGKLNSDAFNLFIDDLKYRFGTTNVVVVKDAKKETYWRKKIYPEYKDNRKKREVDVKFVKGLKDVLDHCDIYVEEGMEADDIISREVRSMKYEDLYVLSSDSDFDQLSFYKNFKRLDMKGNVSSKSKKEALATLITKVLKGDAKDNVKKCHNQHQIRTADLALMVAEVFDSVVDYFKHNKDDSLENVPLKEFVRNAILNRGVDLDDEKFDLNFKIINLIQNEMSATHG